MITKTNDATSIELADLTTYSPPSSSTSKITQKSSICWKKIKRLEEAFQNSKNIITKKTWVILDIDDTLFTSNAPKIFTNIGFMIFQESLKKNYKKNKIKEKIEKYQNDKKIYCAQNPLIFSLIEENAFKTLEQIQKTTQCFLMAMTARKSASSIATEKSFQEHQFSFKKTAPYQQDIIPQTSSKDPASLDWTFKEGILYTNHKLKGPRLVEFIQKVNEKPDHIIMIDDSINQLISIGSSLEQQKISFSLFQYTNEKTTITSKIFKIASLQIATYLNEDKIYSNEQIEHFIQEYQNKQNKKKRWFPFSLFKRRKTT